MVYKYRTCLHQPWWARSKHHTRIPEIPISQTHWNCKIITKMRLRLKAQSKRNCNRRWKNYMPQIHIVKQAINRPQLSFHLWGECPGGGITGLCMTALSEKCNKTFWFDAREEIMGEKNGRFYRFSRFVCCCAPLPSTNCFTHGVWRAIEWQV
jgi:hypothetical protein